MSGGGSGRGWRRAANGGPESGSGGGSGLKRRGEPAVQSLPAMRMCRRAIQAERLPGRAPDACPARARCRPDPTPVPGPCPCPAPARRPGPVPERPVGPARPAPSPARTRRARRPTASPARPTRAAGPDPVPVARWPELLRPAKWIATRVIRVRPDLRVRWR